MVQAGDIRAGGVYFEITADDLPMVRRLAASEGRLRQWVAQQNRIGQVPLTKGTEGQIIQEDLRATASREKSMRTLLARFGAAWTVLQAVNIGLKAYQIGMLGAEVATARASGNIKELGEAQIKVNEAWREAFGSLPIIGGLLGTLAAIYDTSTAAVQRMSVALGEGKAAMEASEKAAKKNRQEMELALAAPAERPEIQARYAAEGRVAHLEATRTQIQNLRANIKREGDAWQREMDLVHDKVQGGFVEWQQASWAAMTGSLRTREDQIREMKETLEGLIRDESAEAADTAKATEVLGKQAALEGGEVGYGKGGSDPIEAARLERLRIEGKTHELIVAQVQAMDRLSDAEKKILIWELEGNRAAEDAIKLEKELADLGERAAKSYEESLKGLQDRAREERGEVDALGLEEEKAIAAQQAADDAAGVSADKSLARTQKLKDAYDKLRKAKSEAADEKKRKADEEELRRAAAEAEKAARPTMSVAGTFSAMAEQIFGGRGGAVERTAKAAEKTAQNTEEIKRRLERTAQPTFGS